MNLVFGILFFWIAGALLYLAIDPSKVSSALTGTQGQSGNKGLNHGDIWSLYTDLFSPLKATS